MAGLTTPGYKNRDSGSLLL